MMSLCSALWTLDTSVMHAAIIRLRVQGPKGFIFLSRKNIRIPRTAFLCTVSLLSADRDTETQRHTHPRRDSEAEIVVMLRCAETSQGAYNDISSITYHHQLDIEASHHHKIVSPYFRTPNPSTVIPKT